MNHPFNLGAAAPRVRDDKPFPDNGQVEVNVKFSDLVSLSVQRFSSLFNRTSSLGKFTDDSD